MWELMRFPKIISWKTISYSTNKLIKINKEKYNHYKCITKIIFKYLYFYPLYGMFIIVNREWCIMKKKTIKHFIYR